MISISAPPIHGEFEAEKIAAFMEEVNGLLAQSIPLIVTDNELSKTFEKEGALRDTLWWLDGEETGVVRDSSRSLSENLRIFEETMNGKEGKDDVPETDYGFFSTEIMEADFGGYFDGLKGAAFCMMPKMNPI